VAFRGQPEDLHQGGQTHDHLVASGILVHLDVEGQELTELERLTIDVACVELLNEFLDGLHCAFEYLRFIEGLNEMLKKSIVVGHNKLL
jgi:hypothetical protein